MTNYERIQKEILSVSGGSDQNLQIPSLDEVAEKGEFQETILKAEFCQEVRSILSNQGNKEYKQLTRLVLLANFLIERVTVVVVSAYNEDYAFDMFESLNNTGQPLTAFETFRPRVIETVGLTKYEKSPSRKFMKPIEDYLEQFKKAEDRQNGTSLMLIPFALAETGEKLSKRHSDQRRYLRDQYDKQQGQLERHKFLEHMSHTATFIEDAWKKGGDAFESLELPYKDTVLMCMDVLGRVNHDIAIGPLVRFYSQIQLAPSESQQTAVLELEKAVKAITALFAFWRGIGKTTGDLASHYRELMKKGTNEPENLSQAFCRCPDGQKEAGKLTAKNFQKALKYILENEGKIASKADWVNILREKPVYKEHKTLARFLLFAALHNSSVDKKNPGLRLVGREETLDMLSWVKWNQDLNIEHIAPQDEERESWGMKFHNKPDLVHYLGNLTLLPKAENSSFGRRPWQEKRLMYRLLSSTTDDEVNTRLQEAEKHNIQLSPTTKDLLLNNKYFPHFSAICEVEEWNIQIVLDRSERLSELVWTNIAPWLGFDKE